MTEFAVFDSFSLNPIVTPEMRNTTFRASFTLDTYGVIYDGNHIQISWNPLYNQPQFIIKHSTQNDSIRGGISMLNQTRNNTMTFQYNYTKNTEYFFGSSDGSAENIDTEYDFISNWNKAQLWLSSVYNNTHPYFNIYIDSNSNKGFISVTQH